MARQPARAGHAGSRRNRRDVNEDRIRLAVTGLSRAGKTVFITSLIHNLLALGGGRNTLPRLNDRLSERGVTRLQDVQLLPAGAAALPCFEHAAISPAERQQWCPVGDSGGGRLGRAEGGRTRSTRPSECRCWGHFCPGRLRPCQLQAFDCMRCETA